MDTTENKKDATSDTVRTISGELPSDNIFVTEHLRTMPNLFSRGILYLTGALVVSVFAYMLLAKIDVVVECGAVAHPSTHKMKILADRDGYVENIYISEGKAVEKGAPLFRIITRDARDYGSIRNGTAASGKAGRRTDADWVNVQRLKLEQNKIRLSSLESELVFWEKEEQRLSRELENARTLLRKGLVANQEFIDAESRLEKARTELRKIISQRDIAAREKTIAEEELSGKVIVAAQAGTVSEVYFRNAGEYVPESTLLCTIVPAESPLYMDIVVANRDVGFIEDGMTIKYKFDAFPYTDYGILSGKIESVSPSAVEDRDLGFVYHVRGTLDRAYYEIKEKRYAVRPGMTAKAELVTERKSIFSFFFRKVRETF